MTRQEILKEVEKCILKDRETTYGKPEDNFKLIAEFWEMYLKKKREDSGIAIYPEDVAVMMSLLKIARIATGQFKMDNFVDLAGYAVCAGELAEKDFMETALGE